MSDFKKTRENLFDSCGNVLKNGKPCQYRKLIGREMCRRCLDKRRLREDPVYRQKRNEARGKRLSKCPKCGGTKAYSSAVCHECRNSGGLSWEQVAVLYSYRNPNDPLTTEAAKRIGDAAMQKIRKLLDNPVDDQSTLFELSTALEALKGEYCG